jgi:hypothetical protein
MFSLNLGNQLSQRLELTEGRLLEKCPKYLQDYLNKNKYDVFGVYEVLNFGNQNYAYVVAYFEKNKLIHQAFFTQDKIIKKGEIING